MADGTIDRGLELPADVRARLQSKLSPARTRARALQKLLERDRFTVGEIWPDLGT
ncbi:MAG: GH3 auxin-responsive promoter family protein, partial [Gammaproteobacteria bacterium]|nr:GH3 auxin-responsive promoter family protein [Gammaproteobacteria bacterium]